MTDFLVSILSRNELDCVLHATLPFSLICSRTADKRGDNRKEDHFWSFGKRTLLYKYPHSLADFDKRILEVVETGSYGSYTENIVATVPNEGRDTDS